jgi:Xaa-Pro aminopeptidase
MEAMETVPAKEIECRIGNFQTCLQEMGLDGAFVLQNADLFYFSGTIQSSVLFIPQEGEPVLMVQKGFERARQESPLKRVIPVTGRTQRGVPVSLRIPRTSWQILSNGLSLVNSSRFQRDKDSSIWIYL